MRPWIVYVATGSPIQWVVRCDGALIDEGTVEREPDVSEPVAVWETLAVALEQTVKDFIVSDTPITIYCNLELVIRQLAGAWEIKHPDIEAIYEDVCDQLDHFGDATFTWLRKADLLEAMNG